MRNSASVLVLQGEWLNPDNEICKLNGCLRFPQLEYLLPPRLYLIQHLLG